MISFFFFSCGCLQLHPKIKTCQPFPSFSMENALFLNSLDVHYIFTMFIQFIDRSTSLFVLMMDLSHLCRCHTSCWGRCSVVNLLDVLSVIWHYRVSLSLQKSCRMAGFIPFHCVRQLPFVSVFLMMQDSAALPSSIRRFSILSRALACGRRIFLYS